MARKGKTKSPKQLPQNQTTKASEERGGEQWQPAAGILLLEGKPQEVSSQQSVPWPPEVPLAGLRLLLASERREHKQSPRAVIQPCPETKPCAQFQCPSWLIESKQTPAGSQVITEQPRATRAEEPAGL